MIEPAIRAHIESAIMEFYFLVDNGRADETADIFCDDGEWYFGPGAPREGTLKKDEISAAMLARSKALFETRHLVTNLLLTNESDDQIVARYLLAVFRHDPATGDTATPMAVDVVETWSRHLDEWCLHRRETLPCFQPADN